MICLSKILGEKKKNTKKQTWAVNGRLSLVLKKQTEQNG